MLASVPSFLLLILMQKKDGMTYAPTSPATEKVVEPGSFPFAAAYLDHGHIFGQCGGLTDAGGTLKWIYDPDTAKAQALKKQFPQADIVDDFGRILEDPDLPLVAAAAIPNRRCEIGLQVLDAGKDYFTDKSPFTTLDQLAAARKKVKETGRKYGVYYSERLHTEAGYYLGELLDQGVIGDVLQVLIMAPHRLSKNQRPDWFFDKEQYGGILTDIGSHQFEQFLTYTKSARGKVNFARVENFANPDQPGLEDFGEASLTMENGASCYCRLDWFTSDGSPVWGDGRTFILGTRGMVETRKYWDMLQPDDPGGRIYLVNDDGPQRIECEGKVGFPFFGQFILDVLNRTENAQSQEHAFLAAELSMQAQALADPSSTDV